MRLLLQWLIGVFLPSQLGRQQTADYTFHYTNIHRTHSERAPGQNSIHAPLLRLHKLSCLSSSSYWVSCSSRFIRASEFYLAGALITLQPLDIGSDTQASGQSSVHLRLQLIQWQRSEAETKRPSGEEDKLQERGIKGAHEYEWCKCCVVKTSWQSLLM